MTETNTSTVDLLWGLFVNRTDRYLIEYPETWSWSQNKLTKKVVANHLNGDVTIAVPEMDRNSETKFVLLDIDGPEHNVEKTDHVTQHLKKTIDAGSSFLKNASRFICTGNGSHLAIFFRQKAPAKLLKEYFLIPLLERCGLTVEGSEWFNADEKMGEIFPRQDTITKDGYGPRLPLGKHKNGNWSKVMFDQDLESVIPIPLGKELVNAFKSELKIRAKKQPEITIDWKTPTDKIALPACILSLMNRKSLHDGTHQNNLDLVHALLISGYSVDDIHEIFSKMEGYRFGASQYQIFYTIQRIKKGILPPKTYKCETYTNATHGLMCDAARCSREGYYTGDHPTMIYDDIGDPIQNDITVGGAPVNQVRKVYKKWLHLVPSDFEFIDVGLVCVLDRDLFGDPLWMFLVAPSGGMKSEIVRSISRYHRAYTLDKLTPQTFISGKIVAVPGSKTDDAPEGVKKPAGILQYLDQKVLVIKDFTVILGMRKEDRYEIFAQLRAIYDGYLEMAFGSMHHPVRVKATIGFVAGVTPAIDDHIKVTTTLGERFLKIRQHPDSMMTTRRSQQNLGYEVPMRREISGAVKSFLMNLRFNKLAEFSKQQEEELIFLANYVAKMRVWVRVKTFQGQIVSIDPVEPEVPTRVVKQLKKLGIGLALVRSHSEVTDEDMNTLKRVARDTCIPMRQRIVEQFIEDSDDSFTYTELKNKTDYHFNSIRIECTKMVQIGILNHVVEGLKDKEGNIYKTVNYLSLTKEFKPCFAAARYTKERSLQEIEEFDTSGDKEEGEIDPTGSEPEPDSEPDPPKQTKSTEETSESRKKKLRLLTVKQFKKWLEPLSDPERGLKDSDIRKAHGENYMKEFSKYIKLGWIEPRQGGTLWWLSAAGKVVLEGAVP